MKCAYQNQNNKLVRSTLHQMIGMTRSESLRVTSCNLDWLQKHVTSFHLGIRW
jgi:hypothetical protein